MGRLFWKFFLAAFATLCLTGIMVVVGMQMYHSRITGRDVDQGPRAQFEVQMCATLFHHSGLESLREFLTSGQYNTDVFVMDRSGQELLGRKLSPELTRRILIYFDHNDLPDSVARISEAGRDYLLFAIFQGFPGVPDGPNNAPPGGNFGPPPVPMDNPGSSMDAPGSPPPNPKVFFHGPPIMEPIAYTLLASLILSALLAWYLSKPINYLRRALKAVGEGRLETRVSGVISRKDEIGELGREFDVMVQRIATLVTAQKRLLHDVSHELRSPLARLQVATGLIRKDSSLLEAGLDRIELETARLDVLVGEILTLSRLETGISNLPYDEINLDELVQGILADAQFEAERKGVHVEMVCSEHCVMLAQQELIRRAIENIVRNGLKFTPQGQPLEIRLTNQGDDCLLQVLDRGPGLAENELEAIFDPFYQSRSGSGSGGFGLGLTIAKRAVQSHGGTIGARNRPEGGLCVEVLLPMKRDTVG